MTVSQSFTDELNALMAQAKWDSARQLFDKGHSGGEMPLAKASISTRRMLVDLMLHGQHEVPTAYFYAGCGQPVTYQILNYLKTAVRQVENRENPFPARARLALDVIVKGCTEMLPESFRRAAELEVYAKAVQLGFPKEFVDDLMADNAFKRALLESDLVI